MPFSAVMDARTSELAECNASRYLIMKSKFYKTTKESMKLKYSSILTEHGLCSGDTSFPWSDHIP